MAVVSFKLFSFYFSLLLSQASALRIYTYPYCADDKGNYTQNSTYYNNLKTLLSNLSSNTEITYGFYNFSYGNNTDKAYAIGLCRGDINPNDCRNCLEQISADLIKKCPNKKEAMSRLDNCILRYSNRSIFGVMESEPWLLLCNTDNAILDPERFSQVLKKMFDGLRKTVLLGDSRRKYAATHVTGPKLQDNIYGLIQCTPDLSSQQCDECLSRAFADLQTCTNDTRVGGTIIKPSCNVRYEKYQFLESTAPPPSSPPPSPPPPPPLGFTNNTSSKGKGNTSRTAIIIAVPIVVVVVVLVLCFIYIYLRVKKPRENIKNPLEDDQIETNESLHFNFDIIRVATNDFSDSNKLGQGGFGAVYWGKLSSGQAIAVKRLCTTSAQGDLEFKNEVLLVAKLQHRNLVRLLGFNLEGRERLLVYEFVPNKSLDYFIFDPTKKAQLDWEKRYKIIGGIARGLLYLHEDSRLRIIHRDLKASNILLDEQMNPKISDFGMARLIVVDQTQANTSRIVGTYGYMAPEYVMHGQFSVKSDVFSFGVLVLEIVSGQKNSGICRGEDVEDLLSFAWRNWREGTVASIIDPSMCNNSRNEIMRCIHIGLLCVQDNIANRPTMATIVLMLNSYSITLPIPSEPAFYMDSRTRSLSIQSWEDNNSRTITRSSESTTKSTRESVYEASITEPYPR